MYPAYPFLALNAAIAFHMFLSYIGSSNPKELIGRVPTKLKLAVVISIMLIAINSGLLRIVSMITAYNAPLKVFEPLEKLDVSGGESVCFGKEWYRFPSSFFLPNNMRAKFIRSEFRGLLPGEFPDATSYQDLAVGTSQVPAGMNDRNEEDPGKYVSQFLYFTYVANRTRLMYLNVHSSSTPISLDTQKPNWNPIMFSMNRSGRDCPARNSLTLPKPAFWAA